MSSERKPQTQATEAEERDRKAKDEARLAHQKLTGNGTAHTQHAPPPISSSFPTRLSAGRASTEPPKRFPPTGPAPQPPGVTPTPLATSSGDPPRRTPPAGHAPQPPGVTAVPLSGPTTVPLAGQRILPHGPAPVPPGVTTVPISRPIPAGRVPGLPGARFLPPGRAPGIPTTTTTGQTPPAAPPATTTAAAATTPAAPTASPSSSSSSPTDIPSTDSSSPTWGSPKSPGLSALRQRPASLISRRSERSLVQVLQKGDASPPVETQFEAAEPADAVAPEAGDPSQAQRSHPKSPLVGLAAPPALSLSASKPMIGSHSKSKSFAEPSKGKKPEQETTETPPAQAQAPAQAPAASGGEKDKMPGEEVFDMRDYQSLKDSVYVFLRDETATAGRGFTYTTELSVREIIERVVRDGGLDATRRYVLGISEIGLYLGAEEKALAVRRFKFVQACNMVGITPIFELFCLSDDAEVVSADVDTLATAVMSDVPLLQNIGQSYSTALSMFRPELTHARRNFTQLRLENELAGRPPIPGEDPAVTSYLRQELLFAYRGSEPPLKDPAKSVAFTCLLPGLKTSCIIQCRADVQIPELMQELFAKFIPDPEVSPETASLGADDYVLKVAGLDEFLVPLEETRVPLTLDAFDYVRRCVAKGEPMELAMVLRATLHPEEEEPSEQSGEVIIDRMLARDVWRQTDKLADFAPMSSLGMCFRLTVLSGRRLKWPETEGKPALPWPYYIYVAAGIYHGGRLCAPLAFTKVAQYAGICVTWDAALEFSISVKRIPREARVCFTMYAAEPSADGTVPTAVGEKHTPLGWCNFLVLDHLMRMQVGEFRLRCWDGAANPIGTCAENTTSSYSPPVLGIRIEPHAPKPVVFVPYEVDQTAQVPVPRLLPNDVKKFKQVNAIDPLVQLTREDIDILWEYRELIRKSKPRSLSKVLRAVDWTIPDMVREAHRLLAVWEPLRPTHALELLDAKFSDVRVREYAVRCLEAMTDAECADFLLQLIQVLKYEPYHDSPLARFLLSRALRNRTRIGHMFYWCLKAEMGVAYISERYGLLLEMYLRGCGAHRRQIEAQNRLLANLERVARALKAAPSKEGRSKALEGLASIEVPEPVPLPLDPRFVVRGIIVPKCRFMDSKKLPLWLVFENADIYGKPIYVIFKVGDDIRQDILTLQMMRIMDSLWKKQGTDLRMQLYRCVATADSVGMIEVVLNSETTANIVKAQGGASAILTDSTVTDWLREFNRAPEEWEKCVETFMLSCAGYCVATYVLGIGDRHSDNVMVTRKGHLFHIDFGHFLGNFKSKLGVKRERAPFKFTPQFAHVFGGKDSPGYKKFEELCANAYNMLRRNSDLFISLFGLMLSTGIPELQSVEDISYLRRAFSLDLDDVAAAQKFRKKIDESLHATSQTINDMLHHFVHR